jgi:hypothetical protein
VAEQRFRKAWVGGSIPPFGSRGYILKSTMVFSRSGRLEEKKQQKRLLIAVAGSVGLLFFLLLFGVKILVGFSLLVDRIRGNSAAPATTGQTIIQPPLLDPFSTVATKSGSLRVTGSGQQGLTVILYVNEKEVKKTIMTKTGTFTSAITGLKDGPNTISAKLADEKGNTSDLSNILSISIKGSAPILEINSPEDNATVRGDTNTVTITGNTEDDTTVTVNGRLIVVKTDNSFSYSYPLNEGDNKLSIEAVDIAGNKTEVERNVRYEK